MSVENKNTKLTIQHYINLAVEEVKNHYPQNDHDRAKLRAVKKLSQTFLNLPVADIEPNDIQDALYPWLSGQCRAGYNEVMTVIRRATSMATQDHTMPYDVCKCITLKSTSVPSAPIDDELYAKIQEEIYTIPGGKLFGLAAHLNIPMTALVSLTFEDCDEHENIVHFTHGNFQKTVQLYDPDGIKIFRDAIAEYKKRMSDPSTFQANSSHFLFITKCGSPYQEDHCKFILRLFKEHTGNPNLSISAINDYIIEKSLCCI